MTRIFLTDSSRGLNVPLEVPDDVIVVFESPKNRTRLDEVFHVSADKGDTWRTLLSPYGGDGRRLLERLYWLIRFEGVGGVGSRRPRVVIGRCS